VTHMEFWRNESSQNKHQWCARVVCEEEPPSLIEKSDLLRDECGGGPVDESGGPLGTA
jgi:hypothetical protein